jgi:hypothetical protein
LEISHFFLLLLDFDFIFSPWLTLRNEQEQVLFVFFFSIRSSFSFFWHPRHQTKRKFSSTFTFFFLNRRGKELKFSFRRCEMKRWW